MSKRISFWLAWFALVLYLIITLFSELLTLKNAPSELLSDIFYDLILLVFITVGAFIASRRPENPIGWIICTGTLIWALSFLGLEYGVYALISMPGALPGGALMSLFGAVGRGIGWFFIMTFLLLLFPNGQLPSSRWRPLAWFIAGLLTAYTITLLLDPTPFINVDPRLATVPNPLRISGASALFDQINSLLGLVLLATVLPCIASVIVRFRRSKGDERQQLKWMVYGMLLSLLIVVAIIVFTFANINTGPLASTLFYLPVLSITISAGIAMLKYRLYDIDVLINRTMVYGSLSALLVLLYVGLIFVMQFLFQGMFTPNNGVAIVISTLTIAALFQPLRRRTQNVIDRRFYRRKYDADKIVETFSATLRNEVDLGTLSEHLIAVVQETMQPTHVSLWLRKNEQSRKPDTDG